MGAQQQNRRQRWRVAAKSWAEVQRFGQLFVK